MRVQAIFGCLLFLACASAPPAVTQKRRLTAPTPAPVVKVTPPAQPVQTLAKPSFADRAAAATTADDAPTLLLDELPAGWTVDPEPAPNGTLRIHHVSKKAVIVVGLRRSCDESLAEMLQQEQSRSAKPGMTFKKIVVTDSGRTAKLEYVDHKSFNEPVTGYLILRRFTARPNATLIISAVMAVKSAPKVSVEMAKIALGIDVR